MVKYIYKDLIIFYKKKFVFIFYIKDFDKKCEDKDNLLKQKEKKHKY